MTAVAPSPSPDALVDPRPIHRGEGPRGVLLLHGLTGTPYDVAPFAEALFARGFAVRAPLLAGHSDLASLESTSWRVRASDPDLELAETQAKLQAMLSAIVRP